MSNSIVSDFHEIINSRSILKALIVKNLVGRYRNSLLGIGWHFIMPIVSLFVYYIVFSQIRISPIPNFWIYLASGLFPFTFMLNNLVNGANCIVDNANMLKKIYFPREIIVISQVLSSLVVTLIGFAAIICATVASGYVLTIYALLIPAVFVIMIIFVTGCVFIFSSLTVYVRDVQHLLNTISMAFFFLTPMYFTLEDVSGFSELIVWLNPFTYFVELFHHTVYYGTMPSTLLVTSSLFISLITFLIGIGLFRKLKRGFAERL